MLYFYPDISSGFLFYGGLVILFTDRLKLARSECKLTQQQIADMLGIDRSTYSYYELGVSEPSYEKIIALARIFKTDVEWLIGADKGAEDWNAADSELKVIKASKMKQMSELSKDERQLVSLYRMAAANNDKKKIIATLMSYIYDSENSED